MMSHRLHSRECERNLGLVRQLISEQRDGSYVPVAVKAMPLEARAGIGDGDATPGIGRGRVPTNAESGPTVRRANEAHDRGQVDEWGAAPIHRDVREQPCSILFHLLVRKVVITKPVRLARRKKGRTSTTGRWASAAVDWACRYAGRPMCSTLDRPRSSRCRDRDTHPRCDAIEMPTEWPSRPWWRWPDHESWTTRCGVFAGRQFLNAPTSSFFLGPPKSSAAVAVSHAPGDVPKLRVLDRHSRVLALPCRL